MSSVFRATKASGPSPFGYPIGSFQLSDVGQDDAAMISHLLREIGYQGGVACTELTHPAAMRDLEILQPPRWRPSHVLHRLAKTDCRTRLRYSLPSSST